jgi:small subunit ribosomal protein S6
VNTTKRTYETLYILKPTSTEEKVDEVISAMSKIVTDQGGDVTAAGRWDKRRLAYEIKGFRDGLYCLMYFVAESEVPKELDRLMKISDDIIRHIILKVEPQYVDPTRIIHPAQPAEEVPAPVVEASEVAEATEETTPVEETAAVEEAAVEEKVEVVETAEAVEEPVVENAE